MSVSGTAPADIGTQRRGHVVCQLRLTTWPLMDEHWMSCVLWLFGASCDTGVMTEWGRAYRTARCMTGWDVSLRLGTCRVTAYSSRQLFTMHFSFMQQCFPSSCPFPPYSFPSPFLSSIYPRPFPSLVPPFPSSSFPFLFLTFFLPIFPNRARGSANCMLWAPAEGY